EMLGTLRPDSANIRQQLFLPAFLQIENNNRNKISTRRAAVKNRLCGDFIGGELRLQISAPFIERGHDNEDHGCAEHYPSKERNVLIRAQLVPAAQDPFVD